MTETVRQGTADGGGRLRPLFGWRSKTEYSGPGEVALAGHIGEGWGDSRNAGLQCRVNRLSVIPARKSKKTVYTSYPPAFKVDDFTGRLVEDRAMVQGIVDIGANVEYVLVHRRLAGSRGEVVPPTS